MFFVLRMTSERFTDRRLVLLSILLAVFGLILLRHCVFLFGVVTTEESVKFVQSFALDEELALQLLLLGHTKHVVRYYAVLWHSNQILQTNQCEKEKYMHHHFL